MKSVVEIRKQIRTARRQIQDDDRVAWQQAISKRFAELPDYKAAKKVAGFLAFDGEADPIELMTSAVESGKQVFVPIIIAKKQPLKFAAWRPDAAMKPNRFGILEPDVPESEFIDGNKLEFVITPLVAFDESCNRIGVGGGFYDRTFEFAANERESVRLFGFAFEVQKLDSIKSNTWDVTLDGIATQTKLYTRVGCA